MVRGVRVKEHQFGSISINGSNLSSVYTPTSINGTIIKVEASTNGAGSIFLKVSGTNEAIMNGAGGWSGTQAIQAYPKVQVKDNTNTLIAHTSGNNIWTDFATNGPMFYAGSGFTSGTNNILNYLKLYYI